MNETVVKEHDEIDLLDLLVIVAESWVLLVAGTILAAAAAYVYVMVQPMSYSTSTVLTLPVTEARHTLDAGTEIETPVSLVALDSAEITVAEGETMEGTRITVTADSPSAARDQLASVIADFDTVLGQPMREKRETQLRSQLTESEGRLTEINETSERVVAAMERIEAEPRFDGAAFAELAKIEQQLENERFSLTQRIQQLQLTLNELPESIVASAPNAPEAVDRSSAILVAALAGIAAGFVLLVFVFARHGVRAARKNPEGAAKLDRIKKALLLRSRTTT